ncbi:MAG: flippase-like domain-containing protein, partial [Candidatus Omnitrophica bacterium]|nr:flippase-like domain-containing protein [Candidatus Omnitrophota bacterium]
MIRTGVSLFFVGFLFYVVRGDLPLIGKVLQNVKTPLLLTAAAVFFLTVFVMAKRLQLIFAVSDVPLRLSESANLTFIGYFFNNFLPTSVGGDVVKALCASRITGETMKSVTSVLMDRIFGLFTFVVIPSFTFLFVIREVSNTSVPILIYALLSFSFVGGALLFSRRLAKRLGFLGRWSNLFGLREKLRELYEGLHRFRYHKAAVLEALFLSFLGQSIAIFVLYLMAAALGAQAKPLYFYILVPVVHLVSMLPSLNGLGIRESAYIYFLGPSIGREYAAALGVLWLGLLFLLSVVGGVIYLLRHDYH